MKQKFLQFVERVWNRGDIDSLTDYVTEDYVEHRPEGLVEGAEELRRVLSAMRATFPDFWTELHALCADESFVACTYSVVGTMLGNFGPLTATRKPVRIEGSYMGRLEGERIAESWNRYDLLSVLVELGVIPAPAETFDLSQLIASQQPRPLG